MTATPTLPVHPRLTAAITAHFLKLYQTDRRMARQYLGKTLGLRKSQRNEWARRIVQSGIGHVLATPNGAKPALLTAAPVGRQIRRLFLDLEVSANLVMSWRTGYDLNIQPDAIVKERAIICACWKWEGETTVHSLVWDENQDDKELIRALLPVVAQADELVGHNLGRFDWPWLKTRALFHGFTAIPDVKVVDTCTWARRQFYFNSNKLDYLASLLGFGGKLKTGFDLWRRIMLERDAAALHDMVVYCKRDVILLEKVYHRLAAIVAAKTHVGVLAGLDKWTCPRTGSTNVKLSKTRVTAVGTTQYQFQNLDTGSYYSVNATAYARYLAAKKVGK